MGESVVIRPILTHPLKGVALELCLQLLCGLLLGALILQAKGVMSVWPTVEMVGVAGSHPEMWFCSLFALLTHDVALA